MDRKLDEELCRKYPILFGDRNASMRTTAMCWGFSCGDGWYNLLDEAASKLEPLCRAIYEKEAAREKKWYKYVRSAIAPTARFWRPFNMLWTLLYKIVNLIQPNVYNNAIYYFGGPPCRASQVKEKFGTLRFYMTSQTPEMDTIIAEAERKSAITCEVCGKKGRVRGRGWLYTACAPCAKRRENR